VARLCESNEAALQQQRVHAVGVDNLLARRPLEDGEAAILGCHQGGGIALIVYELYRGEMARAPKLRGRG
jgi:hypothetical protein